MTNSHKVAIITPIYKHSSLLSESVYSVLNLSADPKVIQILVNDGCVFEETHKICSLFAEKFPDRIIYLIKRNGGLSDARNYGIKYVLERLPNIDAFYFLDADNRLQTNAIKNAYKELKANKKIDWIYPNINMFGLEWFGDYGGSYSLLLNSVINICEAGSLIRRRVFESGVFFDPSFKFGWEDWDFFLSAAEAGYKGKNSENLGFEYRKRPESMLAGSNRKKDALNAVLSNKHSQLSKINKLIELEASEAPRFAFVFSNEDKVDFFLDPYHETKQTISKQIFEYKLWKYAYFDGAETFPTILFIAPRSIYNLLIEHNLYYWFLWLCETNVTENNSIVFFDFSINSNCRFIINTKECQAAVDYLSSSSAVAIKRDLLLEIVKDESRLYIDSLFTDNPQPITKKIEISIPSKKKSSIPINNYALFDLIKLVGLLKASQWGEYINYNFSARENGINIKGELHKVARSKCGGSVVYPVLKKENKVNIGFLLPMAEYGGVEKVALQIAKVLKLNGYLVHAFILDKKDILATDIWIECFETTSFYLDSNYETWGESNQNYFGTPIPNWSLNGDKSPLIGMLHWLDVVIDFHSGAAAAVFGSLKDMGITTMTSLHLHDRSVLNRMIGNPYLSLAYEHSYDYFLPCSQSLADWLNGMGVPRDKIIPVRNGPGFEIDNQQCKRSLRSKLGKSSSEALNILYLGRFDYQKGIDRVFRIADELLDKELRINLRIVGNKVIESNYNIAIPEHLKIYCENPLTCTRDIGNAFEWADILLLPSRYEGLPLVICEAMRFGVTTISTDTGSISEVIKNDINGLLAPDDRSEIAITELVHELYLNRDKLKKIAVNALNDSLSNVWLDNCKTLIETLRIISS